MQPKIPFRSNRDATSTDQSSESHERSVTTSSGETDGPDQALSKDVLFDLLQNERRRRVVQYLEANGNEANLGEIAEHIAAVEHDTSVAALNSQQRKRVYVGLYQSHMPKLNDAGVVEYDQERGNVRLGPAAPQLDPYISPREESPGRPWPRYYLGLGLASAAVLGLAVGSGLVSGVAGTVLALAIVGCLCSLAVLHTVARDR